MASNHALRALRLLDLTSLGDDDQPADVDRLCEAATTPFGNVAAVCVWPRFVEQAAKLVEPAGIRVASVANFPAGDDDIDRAVADARTIVRHGGDEVDVVFPWRALAAGESGVGRKLVAATRDAVPEAGLKVILETGELVDPDLIRAAATEALDGGADFLKTSTGKTATSATPEAVRVLLEVVAERGGAAGVKVSGGVRTAGEAASYLAMADEILGPDWATPDTFRFGASSLLVDLLKVLREL